MTDAAKATVWQATWTPFGAPHSLSGTALNNLRFPGQYFQIETGLAYNWHRTYDPTTGRYTQPDPLRFIDGPSVYAYAGNSPFMETDRSGLSTRQLEYSNSPKPTSAASETQMAATTGNFSYACKCLGINPKSASRALHAAKKSHGLGGADNCVFDLDNGNILFGGEAIGNLND